MANLHSQYNATSKAKTGEPTIPVADPDVESATTDVPYKKNGALLDAEIVKAFDQVDVEPGAGVSDGSSPNIPIAVKEEINDEFVDQLFKTQRENLTGTTKLEKSSIEIFHKMLALDIAGYLGIKKNQLIAKLNLDDVSERHGRRLLQTAINEREIGVTPNTLIESHSRELDKLDSPDEKRQAYEMAVRSAGEGRLTASHFQRAAQRVIDLRLPKLEKQGDVQQTPKQSQGKNTAVEIMKSIKQSSAPENAKLFKDIIEGSQEIQTIVRKLTSTKLVDEEKGVLLYLLENWD